MPSTCRSPSHCPAKFCTSASDFGSFSIRRTCASSTAGSVSRPSSASAISSASGWLLQRKYDRREASSRPVSALRPEPGAGVSTTWKRKCGDRSTPRSANFTASSKPSPEVRTSVYTLISSATSASDGGRRHARRARRSTIRRAQGSSPVRAGSHTRSAAGSRPPVEAGAATSSQSTRRLRSVFVLGS